jgi:signal transduction histidine kinase/DNA-binding response OmpR family regulator
MTSVKEVFPSAWMNYAVFFCVIGFFIRFAFFKSVLARIYIAGAVWLLVFTVMGILWGDVIELPFNPWPIGQVGQLLIYAAALAYKVRLNEKAKAEATRIRDMDEIKSKFFANISHEFRTPLTLIQGPLQQIEENTRRNEEAATVPLRHIKTMRRNTDRLLELVNQLLDLSKLDSGKMKLQIIKGDVLQLLKALTASYDSMAERKGIHYHVHFPEGTTIAFFDKDKLEKIVSNLLGNALKYTNEGGTVSVDVAIEENRLRIAVDDNGPGIAKKELDKIFDRFYQVEGTEDKGSGIGLALVKELVDLYRGQISVSSEPGKGSRFKVSLPVEKASFKENELVYGEWKSEEAFINRSIEETEETINKEITQSTLPLLLVVEDNADLRNFIKETVQSNYQIIEATNGKEGLEKAIAEVPDIIVSDVMMPVMDGFALAEKLKKDERTSHIPLILLTAKAGQQHKLEGLETGADDYLTKPFDAKELLVRIQNLIHQRKLLRKKFAGEILLKPSEVAVNSADEVFLNKIMKAIEENMSEEEFGVEALAKEAAMSRSQLHRKLVALTGQSPSEILRNTRLLRAKELLQKKSATPSEVAFKVGFNSHAYFSKCFKEEFGVSPSEVS